MIQQKSNLELGGECACRSANRRQSCESRSKTIPIRKLRKRVRSKRRTKSHRRPAPGANLGVQQNQNGCRTCISFLCRSNASSLHKACNSMWIVATDAIRCKRKYAHLPRTQKREDNRIRRRTNKAKYTYSRSRKCISTLSREFRIHLVAIMQALKT